jgi:hypothetical protein
MAREHPKHPSDGKRGAVRFLNYVKGNNDKTGQHAGKILYIYTAMSGIALRTSNHSAGAI